MATPTYVIIETGLSDAKPVVVHGVESRWQTARDVTGLSTADNSGTITDPDLHITVQPYSFVLDARGLSGTHLLARVKHQCTTTGSITIQAWGRSDISGPWMILPTKAGATTLTIATTTLALGEITSGGYAYTDASDIDDAFDRLGCRYVVFGLTSALAATGHATASLEVKPI